MASSTKIELRVLIADDSAAVRPALPEMFRGVAGVSGLLRGGAGLLVGISQAGGVGVAASAESFVIPWEQPA